MFFTLRFKIIATLLFVCMTVALAVGGTAYWTLMQDFNTAAREQAFSNFQSDIQAYLGKYGSWENAQRNLSFPEFVMRRRSGSKGEPGTIDPEGIIPFRPPPFHFLLADPQGRVLLATGGYREGQTVEKAVLRQAKPISENGRVAAFALPVGTPQLSVQDHAYLDAMRKALLYGMLVAIAVALVLGLLLGSRLGARVRELTAAVRAVHADDKLLQRVSVRSRDEIGELAAAFNRMSRELALAHAALENDVEQLKQSEKAVRTSEARLARAELAAKFGNWEFHLGSREVLVSKGAIKAYGLAGDQIDYETIKSIPLPEYRRQLDAAMAALIQHDEPYDVEFRIRAADTGEIKDIHSVATFDPASRTVFGIVQDVTDRKAVERELERLARIDQLTGLPNRSHFMSLAEQELARTSRYGGEMSVLMVDVDNFKAINDTHGHQIGDRVLQAMGHVFRRTLREVDFVGRVGGEEFAIVLPQTGVMQAFEAAERLRRAVEQTEFPLDHGLPLYVTISIGMTSNASAQANIDTLLSRADKALYEAKGEGRNRVCIFETAQRTGQISGGSRLGDASDSSAA